MSKTIKLTNQSAHPVRNDGGVDWITTYILSGTFIVVDDVMDNYGGVLFVDDPWEPVFHWAIKYEDLAA